jgi:hypothetical protein
MPNVRIVSRYQHDDWNVQWVHSTVVSFVGFPTRAALAAYFNPWNTAYLIRCNNAVKLIEVRYSDADFPGDLQVIQGGDPLISQAAGSGGVDTVNRPASIYFRIVGRGGAGVGGISGWNLHGIAESQLVANGKLNGAVGTALLTAAAAYFQQYRPVANSAGPIINPAQTFPLWTCNALPYERKLGLGELLAGQQRRYSRVA